MNYLISGLLLWSVVHLMPSVLPGIRRGLVQGLGEGAYKGLFSLLIVGSIALIVIGWQNTPVEMLYQPPAWGRDACFVLMALALLLFISGRKPNNIRRVLRHPQLSSVLVISAAHLLANGDNRSVILFLGLSSWAVLEMFFISRREGAWKRPEPFPLKANIMVCIIAAIAYTVFLFVHPYLFGVPLI
jgi:uncharacterized membrane protein